MLRYMPHWLLGVLLVSVMAPGGSHGEPGAESLTAKAYIFAPGDVIEITVSSHTGYDRTLTIQPDGRIQVPIAGEMIAAGLTVAQLTERVRNALNRELVDPAVTISLKEQRQSNLPRASILGAVRSPGVFELKDKSTVADLLATAGGPLPLADLAHVTIARGDRSRVLSVDLSRAPRTGNLDGDVALEAGDLVIVPTGPAPTVLVLGEVARPGKYEFQEKSRVSDALAQAGGATLRAGLSQVRLTRGERAQVLNLQPFFLGSATPGSEEDPLLQPGDILVLPVSEQLVYLIGEVAKPDAYPLRDGDRLLDLLTRAGGPTREANPRKALLIRRQGGGNATSQPLDLRPMLTKGDLRSNQVLHPGDVVLIPSKTMKNPSALPSLLFPFTSLINLFR